VNLAIDFATKTTLKNEHIEEKIAMRANDMSCTQEPRYPICKSAPTIFLDSKKKQMTDKSTSTFEIRAAGQICLSRVIKSASKTEIGSVHNYDTKSMCESFLSA
jgi:hypothetical protein